ncbi:MAG: GNAT family N-acetyltransferase [Burkholderiales bacterium]|nr:GNAT family N-acetyltransferase [Burkholderiales bacterium]
MGDPGAEEQAAEEQGTHDEDGATEPARKAPAVLERWQAADGRVLVIRPLFSDDMTREPRFLESLSTDTRYERLFGHRGVLRPGEPRQLVNFDVRREVALLAAAAEPGDEEIIAVARPRNSDDAAGVGEFALVVSDAWQHMGIGTHLLERLLHVARQAGVREVTGTTRSSNTPMKRLARKLGFALAPDPEDASLTRLSLDLTRPAVPR